jgi:SAM-dependent methyltransferase
MLMILLYRNFSGHMLYLMNTGRVTQPMRSLGLMHVLDNFKFIFQLLKYKRSNQQFKSSHPDIALPPNYMLFESFKLDYEKYFTNGKDSAQSLINELSPFIEWKNKNILDWGCGPARLSRHLPTMLPDCIIYATDYNPKTIAWCIENIPSVQFSVNDLYPPTQYESDFFNVIIGISIFTHLSERNHRVWFEELVRILTQGGIVLLTTHGIAFKEIMTEDEKTNFDKGKLVVRGKVKEGHRVFTAFHPPEYMTALFNSKCIILQHKQGSKKDWGIEQDTWILKKK